MNRKEFSEVFDMAKTGKNLPSYFSESLLPLHGCGLPGFERVTVTKEVAASMLRGNAILLNGEVDSKELNTMATIFRHRVSVV